MGKRGELWFLIEAGCRGKLKKKREQGGGKTQKPHGGTGDFGERRSGGDKSESTWTPTKDLVSWDNKDGA